MWKSFRTVIKIFNIISIFKSSTIVIVALVLVLASLTGCHLPITARKPDPQIFGNINDFSTEPVDIQFQLKVAQPALPTEKFVLEILDDVTGLPYNKSQIELKPLDELIYVTALTVPKGSVIKYRYLKMDQTVVYEVSSFGETVEYRMYYASGNAIITDVLQGWQGSETQHLISGFIRGTLLDEDTDQPIPDILVAAGGKRTFTDANGNFFLEGIGQGVHNVVFYAIDGQYRTYQQDAKIEPGMTTTANVKLTRMPAINITFVINQMKDAFGAPIYIAGNILQLGNTFSARNGGMGINPLRMPMLSPNHDDTLSITLQLYAETDLRYKFTLGDGYWNSEQYLAGGFRTRQLIVPSKDVIIEHTIESWRSNGVEPITFSVTIPPNSTSNNVKFIQFTTDTWTEPIPLWPVGDDQYLFILFSPLNLNQAINYRFCHTENCQRSMDAESIKSARQVEPSKNAQTITLTLNQWQNWTVYDGSAYLQEAYIPIKPPMFSTIIELTPEINPSWLAYTPQAMASLKQTGADTLIFSPEWTVNFHSPYLRPQIGKTPFSSELLSLIKSAQSQGLNISLYPQIGPFHLMEDWWMSKSHTEAWWNEYFISYSESILGYAKLAESVNAKALILGGKQLTPAFEGGVFPDGSESDIPAGFDDHWYGLLADIQQIFSGNIIWATQVNQEMDPLPGFLFEFDGIYISIDAPLALEERPTFETVQSGFTNIIDRHIYEVYRSTGLPITLAFAYPSVETAASGCALLNQACYNDGLFHPDELLAYETSLAEQALIYNAILPILASREWITGISIRGYEPTVVVHDGTSSIAGKPAFDIIQYWYNNLKP